MIDLLKSKLSGLTPGDLDRVRHARDATGDRADRVRREFRPHQRHAHRTGASSSSRIASHARPSRPDAQAQRTNTMSAVKHDQEDVAGQTHRTGRAVPSRSTVRVNVGPEILSTGLMPWVAVRDVDADVLLVGVVEELRNDLTEAEGHQREIIARRRRSVRRTDDDAGHRGDDGRRDEHDPELMWMPCGEKAGALPNQLIFRCKEEADMSHRRTYDPIAQNAT